MTYLVLEIQTLRKYTIHLYGIILMHPLFNTHTLKVDVISLWRVRKSVHIQNFVYLHTFLTEIMH